MPDLACLGETCLQKTLAAFLKIIDVLSMSPSLPPTTPHTEAMELFHAICILFHNHRIDLVVIAHTVQYKSKCQEG